MDDWQIGVVVLGPITHRPIATHPPIARSPIPIAYVRYVSVEVAQEDGGQSQERGKTAHVGERRDEHGGRQGRIDLERPSARAGSACPAVAATNRLKTIAIPSSAPSIGSRLDHPRHHGRRDHAGSHAVADARPAFPSTAPCAHCPQVSSPSARPRTMTVSVWVAALPPMPATIGMNTARAVTLADRALEEAHDTGGEKRGGEVDDEPRQAHAERLGRRREHALVARHAGQPDRCPRWPRP